ncbi:tellurite resistance protein TehA-like permease [Curtobacterium sp. JUb34]|uniref:MFS transporter n=1 Tax=Curtobacterium sp. JUb34 TaxID=2485109 RepID=UPI000F920687|nr:MFS transporter [Curtobacterium sp. JUb34]ROR35908.1 tellurite resistance protein TehA-like permease [Curtobacterium sp. JUb34]
MNSTLAERPRLPLNTFGIAFGTAGLAGTWTVAGVELGAPPAIGEVLWAAAALAWVITIVRSLRRPGGVRGIRADLRHPVLGPFAALVPAVGSLLAAHLSATSPVVGAVGVWVMLVLTTAFGAWFLTSLLTVPRDIGTLHGGYLLPTVAGSLLAAQSLATIGAQTLAVGYFAAGILFWILIGAMLVARLATGPAIPAPLLPTLAIFSAPPAVAGNAWWVISGGAPSTVDTVLAGTMVALLLPHLFLLRRYLTSGFAIGFWAMTFTTAASATYAVRLLTAADVGALGTALAWVVVGVATVIVGSIATRSLGLLRRSEADGPRRSSATYRRTALVGVVIASVAVAFGAGAGSPLFVVYQSAWGFPDWQLTTAFTAYAVTLLGTLLVAGRLSDHVGRRPVLVGALVLLLVAGALFLVADSVWWVIAARAVQGIATGAATSTFTAAIIELSSERHRRTMTVLTSAAPVGGLALGAFGGGLAAQFAPDPTAAVFLTLGVVLLVGVAAVLAADETADRHSGALASLRPVLAVPAAARTWFGVLAPLTVAGWMFSGLFLGLGPRLDDGVFGIDGGTASAVVIALQPAAAAIAGMLFSRSAARVATAVGAGLLLLGAIGAGTAILAADLPLLVAAAIVGGAGQGAAFGSSLRILGPLADNATRGGLFAAVYLVAYAAYGIPVLVAGFFTDVVGLAEVGAVYAGLVAIAAVAAASGLTARSRRERTAVHAA